MGRAASAFPARELSVQGGLRRLAQYQPCAAGVVWRAETIQRTHARHHSPAGLTALLARRGQPAREDPAGDRSAHQAGDAGRRGSKPTRASDLGPVSRAKDSMKTNLTLASRLTALVLMMGGFPPLVVVLASDDAPWFRLTLGALLFCSAAAVGWGLWVVRSIARPLGEYASRQLDRQGGTPTRAWSIAPPMSLANWRTLSEA